MNFVVPEKMSPRQAWQSFLVALRSMRLAVVRRGSVLEIIAANQGKNQPLPVRSGEAAGSENLSRAVLRPTYASVAELSDALSVFKSSVGEISLLPDSGLVIVTGLWQPHCQHDVHHGGDRSPPGERTGLRRADRTR